VLTNGSGHGVARRQPLSSHALPEEPAAEAAQSDGGHAIIASSPTNGR